MFTLERSRNGLKVSVENEFDLRKAIRALSEAEEEYAIAFESPKPLTEERLAEALGYILDSPGGKLYKTLFAMGGKATDSELKAKTGLKDDNRALAGSFAGPTKLLKNKYGLNRDTFVKHYPPSEKGGGHRYELTDTGHKIFEKITKTNIIEPTNELAVVAG